MARHTAWTVCSTPGCPEYARRGRCDGCRRKAEQRRGTARQRGYDTRHETRFRRAVLARDPACVCAETGHGHGDPCGQPSQHADHHPLSRRELVEQGLDPNDSRHGRGLCQRCHAKETARHQPGGWAA